MVPHNAVCFFEDGSAWCCVFGDFINLQESPAGFGQGFSEALSNLKENHRNSQSAENMNDWYCIRCQRRLPPVEVTYAETCAHCGTSVANLTPAAPKSGEATELSDWNEFRERRIALFKMWSGFPLEEVEKARDAYAAASQPATPAGGGGDIDDGGPYNGIDVYGSLRQIIHDAYQSGRAGTGYTRQVESLQSLEPLIRLASTGSAPAPSAWRPIESAPKDGTYILLSQRWLRDQPFIGWWMAGKWRVDTRSYDTSGDAIVIENIGAQSDIDYWQPLPAAPTQEPQP